MPQCAADARVQPMYSAIFDVDGTLVLSSRRHVANLARVRAFRDILGRPPNVRLGPLLRALREGPTDMHKFCSLSRAFGVEFTPGTRWGVLLVRQYATRLKRAYAHKKNTPRVLPGVAETLRYLSRAGWVLGLGTGNLGASLVALKLAAAGLETQFAFGGFSDSLTSDDLDARGAREVILAAAVRAASTACGARPDGLVFIGEKAEDIAAAQALGLSTLGVLCGCSSQAARNKLRDAVPDLVVEEMSGVAVLNAVRPLRARAKD